MGYSMEHLARDHIWMPDRQGIGHLELDQLLTLFDGGVDGIRAYNRQDQGRTPVLKGSCYPIRA